MPYAVPEIVRPQIDRYSPESVLRTAGRIGRYQYERQSLQPVRRFPFQVIPQIGFMVKAESHQFGTIHHTCASGSDNQGYAVGLGKPDTLLYFGKFP